MSQFKTCPYCGRLLEKKKISFFNEEIVLKCPCRIEADMANDKRISDMEEKQQKKDAVAAFLSNPDIVRRYEDKKFNNFEENEGNKSNLEFCKNFVANFSKYIKSGMGLLVMGGYGCGKTHLEIAVGRKLVAKGYSVKFYKAASLYNEYKKSLSFSSDEEANDFVREVNDCDLLIIDDLGINSLHSDYAYETFLYQIIDFRYANKLPIMISMNCVKSALQTSLTPRVLDRLASMTVSVVNNAPSYRATEKDKELQKARTKIAQSA